MSRRVQRELKKVVGDTEQKDENCSFGVCERVLVFCLFCGQMFTLNLCCDDILAV